MRKIGVLAGFVVAFLALAAAPALASRVVIHEIYYNSPGSDDGSNSSLNGEWIQLKNTSNDNITLKSWTVRDTAGHVFIFGTYTLNANSSVKIHTGSGTGNSTNRYWNNGWYIWNNDKDTGTLKDASGKTLDSCSYNNAGVSYIIC
jgi:hypothetical protein